MTETLMSDEILELEELLRSEEVPFESVSIFDWGNGEGRFASVEICKERVFRIPRGIEAGGYTLFLDDERRLWLEFDL